MAMGTEEEADSQAESMAIRGKAMATKRRIRIVGGRGSRTSRPERVMMREDGWGWMGDVDEIK